MNFVVYSSLTVTLLLTACSTGSDGVYRRTYPTPEEAVVGRLEEAEQMADDLNQYSNTSFSEMPTKGTATFAGFSIIAVDASSRTLALVGLADLKANFDTSRISGTMSDFNGGYADGDINAYNGELAIKNGNIGLPTPNGFVADYSGKLTGNGETVVLGGDINGVFKGTRIRGLFAASDPATTTATIDGTPADDSVLAIVAKKN